MAKVDRRIKGRRKKINKKQRANLAKSMKGNKNAVGADSGRPATYTTAIGKKVRDMLMAMLPVVRIAEILGVHKDTLYTWRKEIPEFYDFWEFGLHGADNQVVRSLQKRAAGFKKRVEKPIKIKDDATGADKIVNHVYTEYHPPDTRAIEMWLKNRPELKKNWSNLPEEDAPPPAPIIQNNTIDLSQLDDSTIKKIIAAIKSGGT
jgi:hypothetical protein